MTIANPPYVLQNRTDHPAEAFRRALAATLSQAGVCGRDDYAVTQNGTPNMSVNVAAGDGFVTCYNALDGMYHAFNDGTVNVAISAAHATLTRWDLVCLRVQDQEQSGVTNTADLFVVAGTPSGSPADPTLPAGASFLVLARVVVGAAVTTIVNANIVERRVQAGAAGGNTVVTSTTRPATPYQGQVIYETDTKNFVSWDGTAWVVMIGQGVWTAFTPTWTGSVTNPVIGNGSLSGRYTVVGKTLHVKINMTAGSTTTYGSGTWRFGLPAGFSLGPLSILHWGTAEGRDNSPLTYSVGTAVYTSSDAAIVCLLGHNGVNTSFVTNIAPWTWANADGLNLTTAVELA